jgi:Zn-dependent peptidase ImmA (M78 family)
MRDNEDMEYQDVSPIGWTKAAVSSIAEKLAKKWGLEPGSPLEGIVERLGGKVEYQDVFSAQDTNDGSILINGIRDFIVYLPDYVSYERNRFTIAHELGHYVLHYVAGKRDGQKVKAARASGPKQNKAEREADWFAAAFLMPKNEFIDAVNKSSVISTARFFGVSTQAAKWQVEYYNNAHSDNGA